MSGTWRPGKAWPTQAQVTYLAALITVTGAVVVLLRWLANGRRSVS